MSTNSRLDTLEASPTDWLLESDEPWTRYRALVDLLDRPEDDPEVQAARAEMLAHPQVQALIAEAAAWPGYALKRHNDAKHPIYKFSTLADFGVRADDPGMLAGIEAVMAHQSPEGAFQITMNIHERYGGTGEDTWRGRSARAAGGGAPGWPGRREWLPLRRRAGVKVPGTGTQG